MFTEHVNQRRGFSDVWVSHRGTIIAQNSRVVAIGKVTRVVGVRTDPVVVNGLVRFELCK